MIGSNENGAPDDIAFNADLTLQRLQPRLDEVWRASQIDEHKRHEFELRLNTHWRPLFKTLFQLYSSRYDFFFHVEQVLTAAARAWADRSEELCELDRHRIIEPDWVQSEKIVGGALYVDLFSENLSELRKCVGYFQELGLTYLHLMPLFAVRPGAVDFAKAGMRDPFRRAARKHHREGHSSWLGRAASSRRTSAVHCGADHRLA